MEEEIFRDLVKSIKEACKIVKGKTKASRIFIHDDKNKLNSKMAKKKKGTTDALEILHRRFIKGDKKRLASIEREREKLDIAQQIYDLRTKAGMTQKQLANLVGTTQSVISRLEDADYTIENIV